MGERQAEREREGERETEDERETGWERERKRENEMIETMMEILEMGWLNRHNKDTK